MTLQEIQYKAQAIMQKWRDEDSAPYVEFVEELASMDVPELPEGLEEAALLYSSPKGRKDPEHLDEYPYSPADKAAFIAGAEYQRKQDQQLIELAEDHAMLAGMNKMKEEMMEKAVEGRVYNSYNLVRESDGSSFHGIELVYPDMDKPYLVAGDTVKVIIIPEEKEI